MVMYLWTSSPIEDFDFIMTDTSVQSGQSFNYQPKETLDFFLSIEP